MDNIDFIPFMGNFLRKKFPLKYDNRNKKQKYSAETVLEDLLLMSKTGNTFVHAQKRMSTSNLHKHAQFLQQNNFFKNTYVSLLSKYLETNKKEKLKYQSIDTTFINNINGSINELKRNKFNKGKYCLKVSFIVDAKGIPLSIIIKKGNVHDSKFFEDHLENMLIEPNLRKIKKYVKCKPYLLADSAYDGVKLRETYGNKGYIPIIPFNNRNTKDPRKKKYLTNEENKIYKKRTIVENSFCWVKKYRRIKEMNERSILAYKSFLFLSLLEIIFRRIKQSK